MACTRQGAEVWPSLLVGGQSLRRALQVKPSVVHTLVERGMPVDPQARRPITPIYSVAALALFLVGLGALGYLFVSPTCDYAEDEGIPRLQARFGFEGHRVNFNSSSGHRAAFVISKVSPEGPFWRAGVRPGDRPASSAGDGSCLLLAAMEASVAGRGGEFGIVRGGTPSSGRGEWMTIKLAPVSGSGASPKSP